MTDTCALILGAGWSHNAGLPLTNSLCDRVDITMPGGDRLEYELVIEAYRRFKRDHPDRNAEQFLAGVFQHAIATPDSCERLTFTGMTPHLQYHTVPAGQPAILPWTWAVQAIQLRLGAPQWRSGPEIFDRNSSSLRYKAVLLARPACAAHADFWRAVRRRFAVTAVVTTNYDVTAERAMREGKGKGAAAAAYHYAAFDGEVKPVNSPYHKDRSRPTTPRGAVALAKLHGSLNWSVEQPQRLVIYPDMRPVWRHGGTAAIVPPLPEKHVPSWLRPVYKAAADGLRHARTWTVVGYSLPIYDVAIAVMLRDAAHDGCVERIVLIDPNWHNLTDRWGAVAPAAAVEGRPDINSAIQAWNPAKQPRLPRRAG